MKTFFVLTSLVAAASAQRLTIVDPTTTSTLTGGSPFTVELRQAQSTADIQQVSVTIAITACYDVCEDPSQWGLGTVLYNGPFAPQYDSSAPQKGWHQDFNLTLPSGWPTGENVVSVAHLLNIGASRIPSFDYSSVHVDVI